jgi:two-component system response regulator HydG
MNRNTSSASALCLQVDSDVAERAARAAGLEPVTVDTVGELLQALARDSWSATLLSLSVEHVDERIAQRIAEQGATGALILTAPAVSLERALLMERVGAVGLLREPLDEDELRSRLAAVADEGAEISWPPLSSTEDRGSAPPLVGESPAMGTVFETVARVARSTSTVLLTGESGTGKEVVARALHAASDRKDGPFVAVNCAAIPEHLLESELFGHERGAFTGAVARRVGRFERAQGGTLFLDEIGDMSLVLQAKVLRVLEDRVVERVGGEKSQPIDVRVIAATNQALGPATEDGRFREDLYYRLAVVELRLPPLRDRGGDVRSLALHFGAQFAERHGKRVGAITERALRRLEQADWPGNVRELRNVMDRAVLLAHGDLIRSSDLRIGRASPSGSAHGGGPASAGYAPELPLEAVESDHIRRVLASVDGHMSQAAETLGIHRNTLTRKMKQYGIETRPGGGTQR